MNFQQLRIIRAAVRMGLNLTEVAEALSTSQSGVSKHIKDLEDELGIEIFVRRGKRLVDMTLPGKEVVEVAERILLDAENIKTIGDQFANKNRGELRLATTHTQARYTLPPVVTQFRVAFPDVKLILLQGGPADIKSMLLDGAADVGIASEVLSNIPELVAFSYFDWRHIVIVPAGHPLERKQEVTIEDIAAYPIITYHEGFTGRAKIDDAFAKVGLVPNVVLAALDADVIKAYVELGLGIGILASVAFDESRDPMLRQVRSSHLFEANTSHIAVRRGTYLRGFACRFMELCAPALTEAHIRSKVVDPESLR